VHSADLRAFCNTVCLSDESHATGDTRIAEPLPKLPYGFGLDECSHAAKEPPYPPFGIGYFPHQYRKDCSNGVLFNKASATAIVQMVSSVNEQPFENSSNSTLLLLLNSKHEPTMSPIIAPVIVYNF
jgi:hypothetical protein